MELTDSLKTVLMETAQTLKGSDRRLFMARIVQELGEGSQRRAQRELGWNRDTLRKGAHELRSGITCADAFRLRGRNPAEVRLPHLLDDIRALVDGQSQTDPQFRNNRLYTRLTAAEVRRQLIAQKGYTEAQLPCEESLRQRLTRLGYHPKKVKKSLPKKRLPKPMPSSTN
jgi:Rhodopirellula transposase DDE domain